MLCIFFLRKLSELILCNSIKVHHFSDILTIENTALYKSTFTLLTYLWSNCTDMHYLASEKLNTSSIIWCKTYFDTLNHLGMWQTIRQTDRHSDSKCCMSLRCTANDRNITQVYKSISIFTQIYGIRNKNSEERKNIIITGWAVALTCCISHSAKHKKMADFDPSESQNPERFWWNLTWLTMSGPHPTWQLWWG